MRQEFFTEPGQAKLGAAALLGRFAVIGTVIGGLVLLFASTAGLFAPHHLGRSRMLAAVTGGKNTPGFRMNHAKGMCLTGHFDSSGAAAALSTASVFKPGTSQVVGRFALAVPLAYVPDQAVPIHSMALRFLASDGQDWRTGMNNIPVFVANSAAGFYDLLTSAAPDPATGKPDPARMGAFFGRHPETLKAFGLVQRGPHSTGFGDATYNGLDSFLFVNADGKAVPVRWSVVPVAPEPITPGDGKNAVFDAVARQIAAHPLQWKLMITLAQPGDPTADATLPWPADRQQIDAGTLTIDHALSEDGGACTDINYDPMVLPPGITASDDPLPAARSAAYAQSFTARAGLRDKKPPSAVTPQEVAP